MIFKYLLRINTEKHPEVMEALNSVKEKDGIALYIRQLIENDLKQKNMKAVETPTAFQEVTATMPQQNTQPILRTPVQKMNLNHGLKKVDDTDDFGGGLA